jgi:hypothetical protein
MAIATFQDCLHAEETYLVSLKTFHVQHTRVIALTFSLTSPQYYFLTVTKRIKSPATDGSANSPYSRDHPEDEYRRMD